MRKSIVVLVIIFMSAYSSQVCHAGLFDTFKKIFSSHKREGVTGVNENVIVNALKEAISIGTDNAVKSVSELDGYLANEAIKILIPEKLKIVSDGLRKIGYNKPIDDFILSMNRAAEKAAPQAKSIFIDAIKEMTFDDAKKILNGSETAATEYFKAKASKKLYDAFNPIISARVNEVGATRFYKDMVNKISSLPFLRTGALDLDDYVTNNALEGLFYMIGEEEKKIRTDPKARVTELLEKVFKKQ
ncbi:hypothetical protein SCALIN_C04_0193 [Candidatus Scalindua japonica]|uniref:DUF4197 domain-containing protein n=1 Tax=Candidatus Scalindua japonica TaxID=1284222 RepID=A0A286TV40_9BACT|nr:DUF4197 domain-containing protein [Candidatus Scalindua japonica]GAX59705.1 hypothetical protein SCALIN_C04_0193 [Candidatus Scalindua japonica]